MKLLDALRRRFDRLRSRTSSSAPAQDRAADAAPPAAAAEAPAAKTREAGRPVVAAAPEVAAAGEAASADSAERLHDLRELDSREVVLRDVDPAVSAAADSAELELVMMLEREAADGSLAIALRSAERELGHVPPGAAGQLAPLLSRLPHDGFVVGAVMEEQPGKGPQLRVHVPRVPALRAHVESLGH